MAGGRGSVNTRGFPWQVAERRLRLEASLRRWPRVGKHSRLPLAGGRVSVNTRSFPWQVAEGNVTGVVSSSGGNAGMAAAYSARRLGVPATIILPTTTPAMMTNRLQQLGARVTVRHIYRYWCNCTTKNVLTFIFRKLYNIY